MLFRSNTQVAQYLPVYGGALSATTITSQNHNPSASATYNLGSGTARWNSAYLSGTLDVQNSVYFGGLGTIQAVSNLQLYSSLGVNNYAWTFDNTGNLTLPTNTFGIKYANGTPVSLGGTYSNTQVAAYLLTNTGNVSANYFLGNGSQLTGLQYSNIGNIYGSSSNVTIQATPYTWTFDNTGNLTIPTTGKILYANGTVFSSGSGSTYGNTQVAQYLPTYTGTFGTLSSLTTSGSITQTYGTGAQGLISMNDGVATNYIVSVGSGYSAWGGSGSLNLLTYQNNPIVFFQNQVEAFRVAPSQYVLMGYTANQNSTKLQVSGGIYASGTANVGAVVTTGNITAGNIIVEIGRAHV